MILRLTPTTAELVGESAAEWEALEKQVRSGGGRAVPELTKRDCSRSRWNSGCRCVWRMLRCGGRGLEPGPPVAEVPEAGILSWPVVAQCPDEL